MAGQSVSRLIAERNVALNNCRSVWKNLCRMMEKQRDEAIRERDEWKRMVERADPPGLVEMRAELNYQRARAEKAEAALAWQVDRAEQVEVALMARAEKAEAALAAEQAQVLAALQERADLAVALAEKAARQ
jgi:hypothetical protein